MSSRWNERSNLTTYVTYPHPTGPQSESEVLEKRESRSKPDRGTVKVHTRVFNQDGTLVAEFKRLVLVPRREPGESAGKGNTEGAVSAPSGD